MKIIARPAPKPLTKSAPIFGLVAVGLLVVMLVLQFAGLDKILSGLNTQFNSQESWAITVTVIVLLAELAAIPFLLRLKLSYLASITSSTAAVMAPWIWVLVLVWSIGEPNVTAVQFGILGRFNIGWWLLGVNVLWSVFNFYTVRQLNIEKVWYDATGLKPRSELKKHRK